MPGRGAQPLIGGFAVLVALAGLGVVGHAGGTEAVAAARPGITDAPVTIQEVRRIGTSVQGRPIRAFRVGKPGADVRAVVLGAIHGDEKAGIAVVKAIRDGDPVKGVDLWLVPTINPDGVAHNRRQNAHGVDLNRNWAHHWARLSGSYYSGTAPFSEPETRAFRDFLREVRPRFIVSFHQPLRGVGRAGERASFIRRLSRNLDLPVQSFNCSGVCHGTMTSWFNARFSGTAVTVEFGRRPSRHWLRTTGAAGTIKAVLGRRPTR